MPTPLPPVQANPDLLEMLVKLLLGTDVADPLGPSPGILGAMVPGAARGARAALPRVRGLAPQLYRGFGTSGLLSPGPQRTGGTMGGGDLQDVLDALRSFRSRTPFASGRRVPATTPARERLANPPIAYQEGPGGPVAPSIDLGPGYPAEPPTREFSRKQLAMLEEIKVSMQKLLRSGLPAEDKPRQMLPAEMSADLARRYRAASQRIGDVRPWDRPGLSRQPSVVDYADARFAAEELSKNTMTSDRSVLEDMVKTILERLLGRLAPRQSPYVRTFAEDINLGILPPDTPPTWSQSP